MRVLSEGHEYALEQVGSGMTQVVGFLRGVGDEKLPGITNQEVLRVLIDRVKYLQQQVACNENTIILSALRQALYYHELRAWRRKRQSINGTNEPHISTNGLEQPPFQECDIESYPVDKDGHIIS